MLKEKYSLLDVSMVKRVQMEFGWAVKRYGAMISENNHAKRVDWCKERIEWRY